MKPALLTLLMLALCWPLWLLGGWLPEQASLDDLALICRVLLIFAGLGLMARLTDAH